MKKTILFLLILSTGFALQAADLTGLRIYLNPGHGGYNPNDRSVWTIPVPEQWTNPNGYWESKSNLVKGLALRDMLQAAGATVVMSRVDNRSGVRDKEYYSPSYWPELEGGGDRDLSDIAEEANANNVDQFYSVHSNALNGLTNYLVVFYHGQTEGNPTNPINLQMAQSCANTLITNQLSVWTSAAGMARADGPFFPGATLWGLGVLRPLTVPGILSEGSFHDYPPETHRLCNDDYCKLEAIRIFQYFHKWYNRDLPTTGTIAGWVKSENEKIDVPKFNYFKGTDDQWLPLNGAKVELLDASGAVLQTYTTDNWYNGVYAFYNLTPGNYKVRISKPDYEPKTRDVTLAASQIAYAKVQLKNLRLMPPDYLNPEQEAGIMALSKYDFENLNVPANPTWLNGSKIKRALYRNDKLYVLTNEPKILVINANTTALIKELNLTGTEKLNDIAFTSDDYLLACNKETVALSNPTTSFKVYTWDDDNSAPYLYFQSTSNGNYTSGIIGETFAASGPRWNCKIYTTSLIAATDPNHWRVMGFRYNEDDGGLVDSKYMEGTAPYSLPFATVGEHPIFTITPNGDRNNIYIDSDGMMPMEFQFDWTKAAGAPLTKIAEFAEVSGYPLPAKARGGNFLRNAKHSYIVMPVCEADGSKTGAVLFDINDGLDKAVKVSEKYPEEGLGATPASYMTAAGVVNGYDIEMVLLAENQGIARYKSKDIPTAGIYASEMAVTSEKVFKFTLNETAQSVVISIFKEGEQLTSHHAGALAKGAHSIDNPFGSTDFDAWAVTATARPVNRPVRLTGSEAKFQFQSLRGVTVDNTPESPFFGRVYATDGNYDSSTAIAGRKGVYILNAALEDVTGQGTTAYNGGVSWSAVSAASPFRLRAAPGGDVYLTDWSDSPTAGVWVMNPTNPTAPFRPVFGGTVNSIGLATYSGIEIHGSVADCFITGTGENTVLYTFDEDALAPGRSADTEYTRSGNVFRYHIGTTTTPWVTAPSGVVYDDVPRGNLQKNGNSQIAPDGRDGWWISQYRADGNSATPCLIHVAQNGSVDYNSTSTITDSYQAGMAVSVDGSILASGGTNKVRIYAVTFNESNIPSLELLYTIEHSAGSTYSCAFDVAGNLYVAANKTLSVWAFPKADNSHTTRISKGSGTGVALIKSAEMIVYPNPVKEDLQITSDELQVAGIEIYNIAGQKVLSLPCPAAQEQTINVSHLTSGIYFLKVGYKTVKIIKQ